MKDELIVMVRIGLYVLAGRLAAGGWLPPGADAHLTSPEAVETVVALIVGAGALLWYLGSRARAALKGLRR
ncbi:MAG: hypothetical protein MUE98_00105 [Rhodobacteraceae bacterium]|jgi:hypothetical protein|nr:hypothetical protein [Paracoccaceae bacterium]